MAFQLWTKCLHSKANPTDICIYSLNKIRKILSSTSTAAVSETLEGANLKISPPLVVQVLKQFQNAGLLNYYFFEWAGRQNGYSHSPEAYYAMIESAGKIKKYGLMWNLLKEMHAKKILAKKPFQIIIRSYALDKRFRMAVDTLQLMKDFGIWPELEDFNALLSALCKSRNVRKAQTLFDDMKSVDGFKPDLKTYSILIQGWGKDPNLTMVKELFQQMLDCGCDPDAVVYGILINSLCKGGKMEEAQEKLQEMIEKLHHPIGPHFYCILIHGYGSLNMLDEAMEVFAKMEREGCVADLPTFNSLIWALCRVDKLGQAYWVLDKMEEGGVKPNVKTYAPILSHLVRDDSLEEANSVFNRMIKKGCEPDLYACTMMAKMFFSQENPDMALMVWKRVIAKQCLPIARTYALFVRCLCDSGRVNEACAIFEEMLDKGFKPMPHTFWRLKKLLKSWNKEDVIKDFLSKLRQYSGKQRSY